MPIYDYKCPNCGRKLENQLVSVEKRDKVIKCIQCHENIKRLVSCGIPQIFPNGGIFFEHASAKGETFHSKQEVRKFAKKNDMDFDILS